MWLLFSDAKAVRTWHFHRLAKALDRRFSKQASQHRVHAPISEARTLDVPEEQETVRETFPPYLRKSGAVGVDLEASPYFVISEDIERPEVHPGTPRSQK